MSGSEDDRTVTDWRTESRFYRRKPGAAWLWVFLAVPLLLALIGWGGLDRAGKADELVLPTVDPSATLTASATPPAATGTADAGLGYPPFSINRNGNSFTLSGQLPDADTKKGLLDTLGLVLPGATIADELTVTPGVKTPEVPALGGLFSDIVRIPDFNLKLEGDTLTLSGTAPAQSVKDSAESYATSAWPNVKVVNNIQVTGVTASPPSATPAPGPGAGGPCATLQADITGLLRTPINFITNGAVLAPESQQLVGQIADNVKACPNVKVAVVGHTDNTGNDAINVPLSGNRAKSVAEALVSGGVTAGSVSSRGAGAANPVASNATPEGRSQNRRVEITVS